MSTKLSPFQMGFVAATERAPDFLRWCVDPSDVVCGPIDTSTAGFSQAAFPGRPCPKLLTFYTTGEILHAVRLAVDGVSAVMIFAPQKYEQPEFDPYGTRATFKAIFSPRSGRR